MQCLKTRALQLCEQGGEQLPGISVHALLCKHDGAKALHAPRSQRPGLRVRLRLDGLGHLIAQRRIQLRARQRRGKANARHGAFGIIQVQRHQVLGIGQGGYLRNLGATPV